MKTKGNFRFSAAHSNLTTLQTNTNAAQAVRSITLAQQLKRSSAAPTNHNNMYMGPEHFRSAPISHECLLYHIWA
jgi:hypothetical protein